MIRSIQFHMGCSGPWEVTESSLEGPVWPQVLRIRRRRAFLAEASSAGGALLTGVRVRPTGARAAIVLLRGWVFPGGCGGAFPGNGGTWLRV